jgi:hypothetical protein
VKRVTEEIEELRYNTSIAALMELLNTLRADSCTQRTLVEGPVIMLARLRRISGRAGSGSDARRRCSMRAGRGGMRRWWWRIRSRW